MGADQKVIDLEMPEVVFADGAGVRAPEVGVVPPVPCDEQVDVPVIEPGRVFPHRCHGRGFDP